jgi:basic membrane protein A
MAFLVTGMLLVVACEDEPEPGLGFSEICQSNDECDSGICSNRRCNQPCNATDSLCPDGRECNMNGLCLLGPPPIEEIRVGYLYVGPVGDHGWTKAHDDGRVYMESMLDNIDVHASPSVAPQDARREIDTFVERGDNVIIGTSFDFLPALQDAAADYPEVNFLTCSGFRTGPNLGSYFGRMYQVMYLLGIIAGSVTETDRIGIVGPVCIPETVRHINAFTRGVRAANPNAEVIVRWVFAWFAPEEEIAATQQLMDEGVDIVFGHTDTVIPMEHVRDNQPEDRTVYTLGYDNPDSCDFAPEICISSGYWNWGPVVTRLLSQIREGEWLPSEIIWETIQTDPNESMMYYAPINEAIVPANVIAQVDSLVGQMAGETEEALYLPFAGGVNDATGQLRYAAGSYPTDANLLNMCWFVEGVNDLDELPTRVPDTCIGDR